MRNLDDIAELLAYNRWAHDRFLEVIETLDPEAVDRQLQSSFPSIRATLLHAVGAEWTWVARWEGGDGALPDDWDDLSIEGLREELGLVAARQDAFLATLADGDLAREVHYHDRSGSPHVSSISHMLLHVVNHATYHRGQLTTMLRQVGSRPPSTDFIRYTRRPAAGGE
ncbi:damage-inducible protein DinB [soil metagenome]